MSQKKQLDIELLRILAAFFVIFNHTNTTGFFLFSLYDLHSLHFWFYLAISIFCKFSVPLFFMISGALMLHRPPEPLKTLWLHRVFHICVVLLCWSFFYYLVAVHEGSEAFSIKHFLAQLYDSNWNGSYWYLYAYIPLLITLPLLQRIAQNLSNKEYLYLFSLYSTFSMLIPSIQYLLFQGRHSLNGSFNFGWIGTNIFIFPLTGYFLQHRAKDFWNIRRIVLLWFTNICSILFSCYLTYLRAQVMGVCDEGHSQAFHGTFVLINCVTLFVTFQYLQNHTHLLERLQRPISSLGGSTFGIYLIHIYIKGHLPTSSHLWTIFRNHLPPMLYAFFLCAVVFFCGYLITLILKRIPILKKLVS